METSMRIASFRADNQTQDLSNTRRKCLLTNRYILCKVHWRVALSRLCH